MLGQQHNDNDYQKNNDGRGSALVAQTSVVVHSAHPNFEVNEMAKRFVDTELWDKQWYMELTSGEKLAIRYIFDKCNCIGLWSPNFKLADIIIGEPIKWIELPVKCNNNIEILPNGKWWLPDFCYFQYGELTVKCPPHKKYIEELRKIGLYERVVKGYPKGSHTLQEKEEDKEEEKDKDIIIQSPYSRPFTGNMFNDNKSFTEKEVLDMAVILGIQEKDAKAFYLHYSSQGWLIGNGLPMANLSSALTKWRNNGYKFEDKPKPESPMSALERFKQNELLKKENNK